VKFLDRFPGRKYSNIKFHENPSSGSQADPCGLTDKGKIHIQRSGQQLVIQFVQTKRSICFHELNHKLLAAPRRCMCVFTLRQADMTMRTAAFRNFAKAPKNI
jgi:hypothetical protein